MSASLLLTGCIDNSYDFSKDIDMTMGLGGNGLGVRLGNTERITLDNLLEVDKSVKLDASQLYYLVENGTTNVNFNVQNVSSTISNTLIHTSTRVLSYASVREQYEQTYGTSIPDGVAISVPAGFNPSGSVVGESRIDFKVEGLDEAIKHLSEVKVQPLKFVLYLKNNSSAGVSFGAKSMENLRITLPKMVHVSQVSTGTLQGNVLTINRADVMADGKIVEITVDAFTPGADGTPNANHELVFSKENASVAVNGTLHFSTSRTFTMSPKSYADVMFDLVVSGNPDGMQSRVVAVEATGRFDPTIDPQVDPIEVSESLPDFLQDNEVALPATNPTVRFAADMKQIPVDLKFSGQLVAEAAGLADRSIELPSTGKAVLNKNAGNVVYFHQAQSPYDPDHQIPTDAQQYQVAGISSLISPLPDRIKVNLGNKRIALPQDKEYTIVLGRAYEARADYDVYVPFEFSRGLKIVYNDSTNSMNSDLKDYAAEGIRISAEVENSIPLQLLGSIRAVDVNGEELPGVRFSEVRIAAGSGDVDHPATSSLVVEATLDNPYDLKKVDRLFFKVHAASAEAEGNHSLVSTQYLRLTNIRLRLLGRIIADFN